MASQVAGPGWRAGVKCALWLGAWVALASDARATPRISVTPSAVEVSAVSGTTATASLTIANTGDSPLTVRLAARGPLPDAGGLLPGETLATVMGEEGSGPPRGEAAAPRASRPWSPVAVQRYTAPWTPVARSSLTGLRVLILHSGGLVDSLQRQLRRFPEFAAVDEWDLSFGTPPLEYMKRYASILMAVNSPSFAAEVTGDVLADYVDQGGGLVLTIASFVSTYEVRGRLLAQDYIPFHLGGTGGGNGLTLGERDTTHAIMEGIRDVTGDIIAVVQPRENAEVVAHWSNGRPLAATRPRVVALNMFVALTGYAGGQTPELLRNAMLWTVAQVPWVHLSASHLVLGPGAQAVVDVEVDAARKISGLYTADLELRHDDPSQPDVRVPLRLTVTGDPRLWLTAGRAELTSQAIFSEQGQETGHRIQVPTPHPDTLRVELTTEGDFGDPGEAATLTIEGVQLLGVGGTGVDCSANSHSVGATKVTVSRWLEDGIVDVRVKNTMLVDALCPTNRHIVRLFYDRPGSLVRFEQAFVGNHRAAELVFENTGAEPLHVTGLRTDSPIFSTPQETLVVAPQSRRSLSFGFHPVTVGLSTGTLRFECDDPEQPSVTVQPEGLGVPPPDVDASPLLVEARLPANGVATRQVSIRNTGASPLVYQLRARGELRAVPLPQGAERTRSPLPPPVDGLQAQDPDDGPRPPGEPTGEDRRVPRSSEGGALPLRPAQRASMPGANVLLLQDAAPWATLANETVLSTFGVAFDVAGSEQLDTLDLQRYKLVIIPSDQPDRTYARIGDNAAKILDFVGAGGVLEAHVSGWGFNAGDASFMTLPGGVIPERQPSDYAQVVMRNHPLVQGLPERLPGTSASHAWLRGLPDNAEIIAVDEFGQPVLAVYALGHGAVVATGITLEFAETYGQAAGPLLGSMLRYTLDAWPQWLTFQPSNGVVYPGQSQTVTLTLQAQGLDAGEHGAELDVISEDPDEPRFAVAVKLQVDGAPDLQVEPRAVTVESRARFIVSGARTSHRIPLNRLPGTALIIDLEIFGDYGGVGENATLYLEGVPLGSLGPLAGDCLIGRISFFVPNSFADFVSADGIAEVTVVNSGFVDPTCSVNEHIVRISHPENPFPLRFRDTFVGGSDIRGFIVRNTGTAPLTIRSMTTSNPSFVVTPSSAVVQPRHVLTVRGEFRPQAPGNQTSTLRISSDSQTFPEVSATWVGRALAAPVLDLGTTGLTGEMVVGERLTREAWVRNRGGSPLAVRWFALSDWRTVPVAPPGMAALAVGSDEPTPQVALPPLPDGHDSATPLPRASAPAPLPPSFASARARVLVVEDFPPWGRLTNEMLLDSLGMPYDRITSAAFETHDLSPYTLVILAGDQTDLYYVRMHHYQPKLQAWVEQGGVLEAHLAAWGTNFGEGSLMTIAGGVHAQAALETRNDIMVPGHPLVAGLLNPFQGTYVSHAQLIGLPSDALVVTRDVNGLPTLALYRLGAGLVIAGTHPYEYGLNNDQPTGRLLKNLIPFALSGSGQWLHVSPERVSVAPGDSVLARFTLDSSGLLGGEYAGSLQLTTNDPLAVWRAIPVNVSVASVRGTLSLSGQRLEPGREGAKLDVRLRLPSGLRSSDVLRESVRLNGVAAAPRRSGGDGDDDDDDEDDGDDDLAAGGSRASPPDVALAATGSDDHRRRSVSLRLRFDRAAVLATLPTAGRGELRMTGALADGGRFVASDSVSVGRECDDEDDDDLLAGGAGARPADAAIPQNPSLRLGPNPMLANGTLRLELALPRGGHTEVEVFSLDGRLVREVANGERAAGTHPIEWDGRDRAGRPAPAGVYLVRVRAPGFAISRRVVRVR